MAYLNVRTTLAVLLYARRSGETATDPLPGFIAVPSQSQEVALASLKPNHCGEW